MCGECVNGGVRGDGDVANLSFKGAHPSRFESHCLCGLLLGSVISVAEVLVLVMRTQSVEMQDCFTDDTQVERDIPDKPR